MIENEYVLVLNNLKYVIFIYLNRGYIFCFPHIWTGEFYQDYYFWYTM